MFLTDIIRNIITAASDQLIEWVSNMLPQVFLFLIFMNAVTRMIGRSRVERLAVRCGSNCILRYMVLPFLSAVVLGNPMAVSMGRYLPEKYKPAYFASVSYHCHTNSGIFSHVNPAELFLWLGIAEGIMSLRLSIVPLAFRYMYAGLVANFVSGYVTEIIIERAANSKNIQLSAKINLRVDSESEGLHVTQNSSYKRDDIGKEDKSVNSGKNSDIPDAEQKKRFRSITITRGDGGYGGPVTVTPTEDRHIVLCLTGGDLRPEPLDRILELSGMTAVNGNQETCPDEKVALAIIDCGGTLRCGIFPGKGIPTVNILATGRSGPLAKYMTKDLYVSAVTSAEVSASVPEKSVAEIRQGEQVFSDFPSGDNRQQSYSGEHPSETNHVLPDILPMRLKRLLSPAAYISRIVSIFYQSAREAVNTCLNMVIPFMGFAALFIGICRGSGLTQFLADLIRPMESSLPGLFMVGIICSVPGLSAILGAGAVAAQMFAAVIGDLITSGSIVPAMALPALFAINCQCACDFIPVGLGMMEARTETVQLGTEAVTLSRFLTGWLRILIALAFSIGLYA